MKLNSSTVVIHLGSFSSQGPLDSVRETFLIVTMREAAAGAWSVQAQEAAQRPAMHRAAPVKGHLAPASAVMGRETLVRRMLQALGSGEWSLPFVNQRMCDYSHGEDQQS